MCAIVFSVDILICKHYKKLSQDTVNIYIFYYLLQDPFDSQSSLFEPATRLCLCEVEDSVVTVVLPSDSSVQIHCMLNGCVVEDVRKGTVSAFPRLGLPVLLLCWQLSEVWFFLANPLIPNCDWCVIFMFAQRLIDKKMATYASVVTSSPSKEMCDIVFCQLPSGEMKGLSPLSIFYKSSLIQVVETVLRVDLKKRLLC